VVLGEDAANLVVKGAGGVEIVAERLLEDHATPRAVVLAQKPRLAEPLDDARKVIRRGREIEKIVTVRTVLAIDLHEQLAKLLVRGLVVEAPRDVVDPLDEP